MTPDQARNLLWQATGLLKLTREDQEAVTRALEVLKPKPEEKKK